MIVSLVAVLLIGAIAWSGAVAGFQSLLGVALPLLAAVVFVCGIIWRITCWWAKSPVPFAIPTTGGQERSLDWIKPNRLDTPMSNAAVVGRMILEVLLFRSLFRNTSAEVSPVGPRATYFSSKWLWVFALIFHYCFLVIFIRHFRFFIEPVPVCLTWLEFVDGIMQMGVPRLFMTDMLIVVAVLFLFGRRLVNPKVRYISLANDYFPLFLIIGQLMFNFFRESTTMAMESVLKNGPLLRKVYIPKYIFPLEKCCFALVNFFFSLVALFIVALLTWSHISVKTVLLAVYPIVMLFIFSLGIGLILSTLYVFVRDIMHIWEVFCTLLVYGSAIFYDPRQMESWMQYIINLNPIYWYITSVRSCVMWGEGLTPNMVLIPFLCAALSLGLGVCVFKKNQDKFVLYM